MNLRKLEKTEHEKTRRLWEEIFTEDTEAFLDYYYSIKTAENEIFVMEEDQTIRSMLQLNPYRLRVNKASFSTNYIIAVATDEKYRKRGLMGRLLKHVMREMYDRKEPFTFLMPAAEAIYYPYDFRFVYNQGQCEVSGREKKEETLKIVLADEKDCVKLAEFANQFLKDEQVVAVRDEKYYRTVLVEQKSEQGGIVMAKRDDHIVGMYCYAKGERYEIREPLFLREEDFLHAVYTLTGNEQERVKCGAYGTEKEVPMIMVRILHLETFLKCFSLKEDVDFYVQVIDSFLEENHHIFHIVGDALNGVTVVGRCETPEHSCGAISVGELTNFMFGYPSKEDRHLEKELKENLKKFIPLSKVFLNEVV